MTLRALLALSAAIVSASSCARDSDRDQDSVDEACEPSGEVIGGPRTGVVGDIKFVVTGGFSGQGDGTSLRVEPDGTLTRQTRLGGTERGKLDQASLEDLVVRALSAEVSTLCHSYICRHCADEYHDELSLELAGSTLTVRASQLAPMPPRLRSVLDALDALVEYPLP
jgi:hypothetical protein